MADYIVWCTDGNALDVKKKWLLLINYHGDGEWRIFIAALKQGHPTKTQIWIELLAMMVSWASSTRPKDETTRKIRIHAWLEHEEINIGERQDWTIWFVTSWWPRLNYYVRQGKELELDRTPYCRYNYSYHLQCTAPRTIKAGEAIPAVAPHRLCKWHNVNKFSRPRGHTLL